MYKPFISLLGVILTYFTTLLSPITQETQLTLPAVNTMNKSQISVETASQAVNEPSASIPETSASKTESFPLEQDEVLNKQLIRQMHEEQRAPEKPINIQPQSNGAVKYAALTFDDGPSEYTPEILNILKENDVHATFFVLGAQAQKNQQTIRQMQAEGHTIGNHTWNHKDLTKSSPTEIKNEIETTNQLIEKITGQGVHLFRPPYGSLNAGVQASIKDEGMQPVLWNVDPADWNLKITSPVQDRVRSGLKENSLILMHDGGGPRSRTVQALAIIIKQMKEQGYQFVTVPEYLELTAHK